MTENLIEGPYRRVSHTNARTLFFAQKYIYTMTLALLHEPLHYPFISLLKQAFFEILGTHYYSMH